MKEIVGFIGSGNMCQVLVSAWLGQNLTTPEEILVSNRTPGKAKKLVEQLGVGLASTNEDLVDKANVVILAVKPQDLVAAIEPIATSFTSDQVVVSLAAGISLRRLKKLLPQCTNLVRVMANTPARVERGAFGYATVGSNVRIDRWMERMFSPIGLVYKLEEGDAFEAFSVATSAGVGFVLELMQYWQEWLEEHEIDPEDALAMTIQTFLGASELALKSQPQGLVDLQSKVTSKKGITAAGLDSMRELEVERLLRYSFEKAALRDRELSED